MQKTKKTVNFTDGKLLKSMIYFALPFMLGVLIQNLYGAADLLIVGNFSDKVNASAVTIGSQLMTIVTQVIIGFASAIVILVGKYRGANDSECLKKVTGSSIIMFFIIGLIFTTVYLLIHPLMVNLMQTPEDAIDFTTDYVFICSFGIIFIVGFNLISGLLSGMGDSKTTFFFILIACVVNILLDILLVRNFNMGAKGAAIATTVAQAFCFICALVYLLIKGLGFDIKKNDIKLNNTENKKMYKIGGPVAIQNVLVTISFLVITAIINQMGLAASAAVGTCEKLITFLFVPAIAFGTTVSTAVSQNIGANEVKRANHCLKLGIFLSLIPSILIFILCEINPSLLTSIFSSDPEVVSLASDYLQSYVLDIIFVSFVFCFNGYFNSIGKSWFSLFHSIITTFILRVPLSFLFANLKDTSLFIIGFAAPLSTLVSIIFCFIFYFHLKNKNKLLSLELLPSK